MKKLICILSLSLMLIPASLSAQTQNDNGFWCAATISPAAAFASNSSRATFAQADVVLGYRFSEFFKVGVGVGPRYVIPVNANTTMMFPKGQFDKIDLPIYLDLRGSLMSQADKKVVPYWSVDGGYGIGQGFFASPTLGIRIGQSRGSFLVGLSYIFQHYDYSKAAMADQFAHAAALKLGYEF